MNPLPRRHSNPLQAARGPRIAGIATQVAKAPLWMLALVLAALLACAPATRAAPAGLFLTDADMQRLRASITGSNDADVQANYTAQRRMAENGLDDVADPFTMSDITKIVYHWCSADNDGVDNSLYDAQRHIEAQSDVVRALALQYALTGDARFGDKALSLMKTWAQQHTPVNVYDFNPDFRAATIDGMTTGGTCSDRPWAFAADTMWQTYGLTNMSDAYLLLVKNGYSISSADNTLLRGWILKMAEAVNSSFHVWTKWADLHPTSSAYERYRNDNHLTWAMLGLLAAGVALDDQALIDYVLEGGTWDDSRSDPYANPVPIRKVMDGAIEANGRVYEERINRDPPIGYAFFHMWPMVMIARIDEVLGYDRVWKYKGADGAGLEAALTRYVPYIMGTPTAGGEGNMTTYAFLYQLAHHWWPENQGFIDARARTPTNQIVRQSAGPTIFMFKNMGPAGDVKRPMPPVITVDP